MSFMVSPILKSPTVLLLLFSIGIASAPCLAGEESSVLICQNNTNPSYNTPQDAFANSNGQYPNYVSPQGQYPNNNQYWSQQNQYSGGGQGMPQGQGYYQNSPDPGQNMPTQNYPQTGQYQPAGQYQQNGQYSGNDPTYYGYANDMQQPAYPNQSQSNQPPTTESNGNISQATLPEQNNESGGGRGSKLMQAGKALAGMAVPLATGYFLTKAANRQARLSGYPAGYGTYGTPYGYNMAPGAGLMNPYGYGNAFANPYGGMSPMGGGLMNMFGY